MNSVVHIDLRRSVVLWRGAVAGEHIVLVGTHDGDVVVLQVEDGAGSMLKVDDKNPHVIRRPPVAEVGMSDEVLVPLLRDAVQQGDPDAEVKKAFLAPAIWSLLSGTLNLYASYSPEAGVWAMWGEPRVFIHQS